MAHLKFSPDMFIEVQEMEQLRTLLDEKGFRKNLIDNTVKFGFIKNIVDPDFINGKVELDLDSGGLKTVKVRPVKGIDVNGQFFFKSQTNSIQIPSDSNWYWLNVRHQYSNIEAGTFSIAANGDLIDTSGTAKLTKWRGMPNFPTRIKFVGSTYNTLEYDVLEIADDQNAVIQHPAPNGLGISAFEPETDLQIKIVGTFTAGVSVPNDSKYPFNYDSASITLVAETIANTPPAVATSVFDLDGNPITTYGFSIARVKSDGTNVVIQDKRSEYWETKGSNLNLEISRATNPLIGVEAVKFNDEFTPGDRNIVEVAWGMRSDNWSIDSANNIVTFNSGTGGKYKTVNDFTNGELDGCRLYTPNGKYHKVLSSIKQGSAINFKTEVLEVNNFSDDGGVTLISGTLLVVPDCEEVELKFTPAPGDTKSYITETFKFPVNTAVAKCDVVVYKDDTVLYNLKYRYKSFKEYTDFKSIPSDTAVGYYTEASFDANGVITGSPTLFPYTAHDTNGFIQLKLSPLSIYKFRNKVDKGDLIGVNEITTLTGVPNVNLVVGVDKNYQNIVGNIVLNSDVYFDLDRASAVEGNEFRIHFNCTSLDLAGNNIFITYAHGTGGEVILKTITQGDVYQMMNQDGGICFDCKYKGLTSTGKWFMYQNYDFGVPFEIKTVDGLISNLFDSGTGLGNVKGLYGFAVCDQVRTIAGVNIPNLKKRFLIGAEPGTTNFDEGDAFGTATHIVTNDNIQAEDIPIDGYVSDAAGGSSSPSLKGDNASNSTDPINVKLGVADPTPIDHTPEYYAVIYAKRVY